MSKDNNEVYGVVQAKTINQQQTKFGLKDKGAVKVNDEWYGTFLNPEVKMALEGIEEGDSVKVTYVVSGQYKNLAGVEKVTAAAKAASPKVAKAVEKAEKRADDKDSRITYLASRKDALQFVDLLIRNDALALGTKKSDKADIIDDAVEHYARLFVDRAYGVETETQAKVVEVSNESKE